MASVSIMKWTAEGPSFPEACMVCGESRPVHTRMHTFTYLPQWVYLFIFCGLLPLLIVALVLQKRQRVGLRLCETCLGRFNWVAPLTWLAALGAIFGLIFGIVLLANESPALGLMVLLLAIGSPVAFHLLYVKRYGISCSLIDDQQIILDLPNDMYPSLYGQYMMAVGAVNMPYAAGYASYPGAPYGPWNGPPGYPPPQYGYPAHPPAFPPGYAPSAPQVGGHFPAVGPGAAPTQGGWESPTAVASQAPSGSGACRRCGAGRRDGGAFCHACGVLLD